MISNIEEYFKNRKLSFNNNNVNPYKKLNDKIFIEYVDKFNFKTNSLSELMLNEINLSRLKDIPFEYFIGIESFSNFKFNYDLNSDVIIFKSEVVFQRKDNIITSRESIDKYFDDLLDNSSIDWSRCYISGGQISKVMRGIFHECEGVGYSGSDTDIYVTIDSLDNLHDFRRVIFDFINGREYKIKIKNNLVYKIKINNKKYDFIPIVNGLLLSHILNFHFSSVKGIYNKNMGLLVSPLCLISSMNMINYLIIDKYITSEVYKKYFRRGYSYLITKKEEELFKNLIINYN